MSRRIHRHITSNLIGYVALFFSLTLGTAQALNGTNTVFTDDIVDGEVRSPDLGANSVGTRKIANGQVTAADLANDTTPNALTGLDIKNESMGGHDIINGDVTGADIDESSLGTVPMAAQGGTGRYAFEGSCDPESARFDNCAFVSVPLMRPGRVLITAQVLVSREDDADSGWGACRLEANGSQIAASETEFWNVRLHEHSTLVAVTDVLSSGAPIVGIECNQDSRIGAVKYPLARVTAVALSAN